MEEPAGYRAYLIRLLPREVDGHPECSVTVESVSTGKRTAFASLDCLVDYLRTRIDATEIPHKTNS